MKPYHAVILFLFIIGCAALTSLHGYRSAMDDIVADMNQALAKTLAEKQEGWITPDTIADYRSHLGISALRQSSVISYAMEGSPGLASRRMAWHSGCGPTLEFQGYANCSWASVFALSDQRLPFSLTLLAMLWAAFSLFYFRRQSIACSQTPGVVVGDMMLDAATSRFLTLSHEEVRLTPMQTALLTMLFRADGHRLSKQDICDALWPKKPDASDTLYTLIRRIRPVLADRGLTIVTERGKDYQLKIK